MRSFRQNCKGQVLVVSGLLVAIILLSTALYVIEVSKDVPNVQSEASVSLDAYKSSIRNTLISALANASGGGDPQVLASDLTQLQGVIESHSYASMLTLSYNLQNGDGYQNGISLNWSSGIGISSATVTCRLRSQATASASEATHTFNVTSQVALSGSYSQENATTKQVTLSLSVSNEGSRALAQNLTFRYQNASDWTDVDSPSILNHGDGTYTVTFNVYDTPASESLAVSAVVVDLRGITVGGNLTCNRI